MSIDHVDDLEAARSEVEQTRAELGRTVEALAYKTDVKARGREKAELAIARAREQAQRALTKAKRLPPPALAGAAAAALLAALVVRRRAR